MSTPAPRSDEDAAIDAVIAALHQQMVADYPEPPMRRDAHPKMTACVQADLTIDRSLPADLRYGVFHRPGHTYRAWVRFSNAQQPTHDLKADTRGMAVKLLEVEGDDAFPGAERQTQDFLAATHDVFFIPNAVEYVDFPAAAARGFIAITWFFVRRRLWRGLAAATKSINLLTRNPSAIPYHSQVPFRLGPHIVKFQLRPMLTESLGQSLPWAPWFSLKVHFISLLLSVGHAIRPLLPLANAMCNRVAPPDYLRRALAASLRSSDAWFELLVQRRTGDMSIEDATIRWDEGISPYRRVAVLRIPRQLFAPECVPEGTPAAVRQATTEMATLGENISMSPWHALKAHEPVGSVNRARRRVYPASSDFRHKVNATTPTLPDEAEYARIATLVRLAPDSIDPEAAPIVAACRSSLTYAYLRRIPLVAGVMAVALPLASIATPIGAATRGIYDVSGAALYLTALLSSLLGLAIATSWSVVTMYAYLRWRVERHFCNYPFGPVFYWVAALLALPPAIATGVVASWSDARHAANWLAAWLVGLGAMFLVASAMRWLVDREPSIPVEETAARRFAAAGYTDPDKGGFLGGHRFAGTLTVVLLVIIVAIAAGTSGAVMLPALVFLLLIAATLTLTLTGLTFLLDRFRTPILTLIALFIVVAADRGNAAHFFALRTPATPVSVEESDVLNAGPGSTAVVVAASGGGLQSAYWTATVLTRLQERCGSQCDFAGALRMVSAASGGSAGAMFVASAYRDGRLPVEPDQLLAIREMAARSVQDWEWRSLLYRDAFWPLRALTPWKSLDDRGAALERAWRLDEGNPTLSEWRADAKRGARPGMIFNSTLEELGRRVTLSTAGRTVATDFVDLYPLRDLDVVTAVRLSSSFPIVVPFAKDDAGIYPDLHFADGGYTDQYAVAAVAEWLDTALVHRRGVKRVLVLQLRTQTPSFPAASPLPDFRNQFERDEAELDVVMRKWAGRVEIVPIAFELRGAASVAWHITAAQRRAIDDEWAADRDGSAAMVVRLLSGR